MRAIPIIACGVLAAEPATFTVPAGKRIDLACPGEMKITYGCSYKYSYLVR